MLCRFTFFLPSLLLWYGVDMYFCKKLKILQVNMILLISSPDQQPYFEECSCSQGVFF